MPDYQRIYATQPEAYRDLVAAEDYEQHLGPTIASLTALHGAQVLEVGMGTGRLTRLLLEGGAEVEGYDQSARMLEVARSHLGPGRYKAILADFRQVSLPRAHVDVAIAGWVLGHFCEWHAPDWRAEIDGALHKMWDSLRPGGTLIVIETLGTGTAAPAPPTSGLAAYYDHLAGAWGMQSKPIRTDYRFAALEQATEAIGFFFGSELAADVRQRGSLVVPEWTGVWWKARPTISTTRSRSRSGSSSLRAR